MENPAGLRQLRRRHDRPTNVALDVAEQLWRSVAANDEFEVGCTYEHAGYILTWLGRIFWSGSARHVVRFDAAFDKGVPADGMAPDFSVGCIEYAERVVARSRAAWSLRPTSL